MIIDYRTTFGAVRAEEYHVLDAATGEPIDESYFYADDELGVYRTYLIKPGCEDQSYTVYYAWHKVTHEPLDHRISAGDPDEHDYEVAWAERRRDIRIVRRDADAGAA